MLEADMHTSRMQVHYLPRALLEHLNATGIELRDPAEWALQFLVPISCLRTVISL